MLNGLYAHESCCMGHDRTQGSWCKLQLILLKRKARKGVQKILGTESLAMASNWQDFIKSDSTYNYMGSWHYVNLPGDLNKQGVYQFLKAEKAPNVYSQVNAMVALLKNKQSTADQQKMALRVLIHLGGRSSPADAYRTERRSWRQ